MEYKKRHDTHGQVVHWELCRKFSIDYSDKLCKHVPKKGEENEEVIILWDFNNKTDQETHRRRPGIVFQINGE